MAYINEITKEKKNENIDTQTKNNAENNKEKIVEKSAFMLEFEKGIIIEEALKQTHAKIDSLWSK